MPKAVIFVVQGEGRGHLSQALAMKTITENLGLFIKKVFVGRSSQRQLPAYFKREFEGLIDEFESPNFLIDEQGQGIKVAKSLWLSFLRLPKYIAFSIRFAKNINRLEADLVINFYEPLLGLSQFFKKVNAPIVSLAHQFLSLHPNFILPQKPRFDKNGLRVLSFISGFGSVKKLGLSFYEFENYPKKRILVVPPLLRQNIHKLKPESGNFYLVYLLNKGYANDIINWQRSNRNVEIEVFWDNFSKPNQYSPQPNLVFNHLDAELFVQKMAVCKALITTAGFESVSEALILGKKVGVVPVKGHYEQKVNSYDATKTGAVVRNESFDLEKIIGDIKKLPKTNFSNAEWLASGNSQIEGVINSLLNK